MPQHHGGWVLLAQRQRNKEIAGAAEKAVSGVKTDKDGFATYADVLNAVNDAGSNQLLRLFYEYMPLIFSRKHGDPSRPWNKFSIRLRDKDGNPVLNYEGNWRDIFQNWEALAFSYPLYVKNMVAKFLNAMTATATTLTASRVKALIGKSQTPLIRGVSSAIGETIKSSTCASC